MLNEQQEQYFEALIADATKAANALESPRLRGVKDSVVEKYSDQAHFIYELLQNADDAQATSARFELFNDKLVFAHNGTRRFSISNPKEEEEDRELGRLGDINAITAVGASSKTKNDTIGKFGVGFKSVFQYTTTPHIYDPNVWFKIERFIVPIRLDVDYPGRNDDETLFVFPFNHEERPPENACADISEKLRSLVFPLLFLSNLKEVKFNFAYSCGGYGKEALETLDFRGTTAERIKLIQTNERGGYGKEALETLDFRGTTAERIKLIQTNETDHEKASENCLWLFSRKDEKGHKYSVGFFMDKEGHLLPQKHYAFCFFPTKAVSELNFIIHAPFLLTDSREGIRAGVQHNIDMISLLSKLAADSLVHLKDIGQSKSVPLIDDNIFDIVPYDSSKFGDVNSKDSISFMPFYTVIKKAFKNEAIILSLEHDYVCSANAYWGGTDNSQLAEVFSNDQLQFLTKNENAKWAFASLSTPRSAGKSVKFDYIREIIQNVVTDNNVIDLLSKDFVEAQTIEWLHALYAYISLNAERTKRIKTKPIFLDSKGQAVAAYDANEHAILFLPIEGIGGYTTVNNSLLENEDTLAFMKRIGVSEPSLQDEIYNIILPQYRDGAALDTRPDFQKFFRYYQTCTQAEAKAFCGMFKDYAFILFTSSDDKTQHLGKASELYFPFEPLIQWFATKPKTKFVCFSEYLQLVGEDNKEKLIDFFTDLGIKDLPRAIERQLSVEEVSQLPDKWPRSTAGQTWTVNEIDGCAELIDAIVKQQDKYLSEFLWSQFLRFIKTGFLKDCSFWFSGSILLGRYQYWYYGQKSLLFESIEARRLRTKPWLLNSNGEFVSAGELKVETLNHRYDVSSDEACALCQILGIKKQVEDIADIDIDIATCAELLGLSAKEQRQAFLEFVQRRQGNDLEGADHENDAHHDAHPHDQDDKGNAIAHDHQDGGDEEEDTSSIPQPIKRVLREISIRVAEAPEERVQEENAAEDSPVDEDDYSKRTVDINKIIEGVKSKAERDIKEIARLEELKQRAQNSKKYSFGWFKTLLELESINSGESNANSREISISFAKVEREPDTERTLILKHPNRYIPQSMEDLADIPLELHFSRDPMVKVAVEVVNVKAYTLRAKLRTHAEIDGIDLSQVTEARIEARNPVFLIEELRKAFLKLGEENGYNDDFDMKDNLCEKIEFVFGPPGTGKTTFLANNVIIEKMREEQPLKVLVLTPTNKASDVLVRRLMQRMETDKKYLDWLVRFGATNDTIIEQSGVFRDKTFDIRNFPRNVTVTTIARFPYDYFLPEEGTRLHLNALKWDYIIIDEASMIPLANIVYPLYKKKPAKFIIAGDPFQIEPITSVDTWKDENIYKMVELNSFTEPKTKPHDYPVTLLTTQYRSIPAIGEVFSNFAYGGVLKHARTAQSQRSLAVEEFMDLQALNIIKFPVSKFESIYRPKRLQSKTPYQVYSALFAFEFVKYLSSLIAPSIENEKFRIGLIAPYRAQADLIDKLMASSVLPQNINVQVGTIHGFQGDECDIIIALFNPPPTISTHPDMFLNKLNIVNVSISRAKDYLIILMPDDKTENIGNLRLVKQVELKII